MSATETPLAILLAAGDIAKCSNRGVDEATAEILVSQITDATKAGIRIHVLALGDLAYDGGTKENFECFAASWGRPELYPHLLPVPGNHDVQKHPDGKAYFDYFSKLPVVAESRARGGYYKVQIFSGDQPVWSLYALNAYIAKDLSSPQVKWLAAELRSDPASCVAAFWHPFLFSSGHWGHRRSKNPNALTKRLNTMVDAFKVLHQLRASVILTGHDHDFEQFAAHDVDGRAAKNGVRTFVVGTGGAPLYRSVKYKTRAPNSEVYNQDTHGVLRIELYKNHYKWSFIAIAGRPPLVVQPAEAACNERRPDP